MSLLDKLLDEIQQLKENSSNTTVVSEGVDKNVFESLQKDFFASQDVISEQSNLIEEYENTVREQDRQIFKLQQQVEELNDQLEEFEVPVFTEDVILTSMKFQKWGKYIETTDSNTPPPEDMSQEIKRGEIFTFVGVFPCWVYRGKSRNFRTGQYEYNWIQEKRVVVKSWNTEETYTIPIQYIIDAKHNARYSALMVAISHGDIPDEFLT